jgi:hypothetical protein
MAKKQIMIKKLKVNLDNIDFSDPEKITDGKNGRILENAMRKQRFPIDSTAIVDLPGVNKHSPGVEVKTRSKTTKACHTIGTMTYDNIINTAWDDSLFKKKLQQQYIVTISKNPLTGKIEAKGQMVNLTSTDIQNKFKQAYESCRSQLTSQGQIINKQTITSGQFGILEHKPTKSGLGKSYAMRIPHSGMKKILTEADSTFNQLFSYT